LKKKEFLTKPKSFSMAKTSLNSLLTRISSLEEAVALRKALKKNNKKIVLTNGCFDLLHPGHIHSLNEASRLGDQLWVAMNSDLSVRGLKGPFRPIIDQENRAFSLLALKAVSLVFLFDQKNLAKEILLLAPDVYVKSDDYSLDTLDPEEKNSLVSVNAQIRFVSQLSGFSTSSLIDKINKQRTTA